MIKIVKAKLNGMWDLYLPEHRANLTEWHTTGWEKPRLLSMSKNIGKDDVVYYVGAELGEMSALCALWGAEVVNFEPNFSAWPSIYQTFKANNLTPLANYAGFCSNVHQPNPPNADGTLYRGLGFNNDADGWPEYAYGEIIEAHGFSELYQEADGLPQYRIDNLVDEGLKPPTVLTMDVEGSECQVLYGAEETIRKYKPIIYMSWHMEFMFHQFGIYTRDMRNWIIDLGYKEHYLDYAHELHMYYEPR